METDVKTALELDMLVLTLLDRKTVKIIWTKLGIETAISQLNKTL